MVANMGAKQSLWYGEMKSDNKMARKHPELARFPKRKVGIRFWSGEIR